MTKKQKNALYYEKFPLVYLGKEPRLAAADIIHAAFKREMSNHCISLR